MTLLRIDLWTLVLLAALPNLARADWPQFRGPSGDGVATATDLPLTWNETTNVAWKTPIPGKGWSSPSLHRGRIYLTSAVPVQEEAASSDLSLRAYCLDAKTGRIVWDRDVFQQDAATAPKIHNKNSHASPTPLVDGDRLYVHFGHQGTARLDLAGNVLWRKVLKYAPVHGNGGSPILVDGHLIFGCDGASDPFVVALDAASGDEKWRFERQGKPVKQFAFCTATAIEAAGRKQVITCGAEVVNALDPATGSEIWRVHHGGYSVIPKPVFGHGLVFLSTGYDSPTVMAIRPEGTGDVTDSHVAWTLKKGAPHTPSLLLVGDELHLISDKGVATCVDARTGEEHWQERIGGNYSSSPLFADGKIFLQSEDGPGVVLKPGKIFEKLADTGFNERTLASYAVGERALFIRTEKNLYRVERKE